VSRKYKTVKVSEDVYKQLKDMGVGISKALEIMVESQKGAIESKVRSIEASAREIAEIMFQKGIFDIRLKGGGVSSVEEDGDDLVIYGFVRISIPDDELRAKVMEVLEGKENV
jgi:predicted CopG family antitoxin